MQTDTGGQEALGWLPFAAMTVFCWGLYGPLLHWGQLAMQDDKGNGRIKAFLFVGLAYFLTAVLAPLAVLWTRSVEWDFPAKAVGWSLLAGILGALGAFALLLAFGAKGHPILVMSIIFAGAPVVNSVFLLCLQLREPDPPQIRWPFLLGILLAASGGCLATLFRPEAAKHAPAPPAVLPDKEK